MRKVEGGMRKVEIGYEKNEEACLREDLLIPNS